MDKKYLQGSQVRVARLSRILAKGIDIFIVLLLSMFFYPLGLIASIVYMCVSDSLQGGQSVGKKFIGFSVVSLKDGTPCSLKQSTIRNLPFIIPLAFGIIPLWGWVFSILLGLPLVGFEFYMLFKIDSGHRLGDVMADTTVIANDPASANYKKKKDSWFEEESSSIASL
ncbi:MAG: hypothetical protein HOE90_07180 [Bacteriovoracaceae bacterium]|jgi:uncharacterized RDD family membrane protein YckC|nr:hypothetical protein [Bacteriovoracaceae bacterium]